MDYDLQLQHYKNTYLFHVIAEGRIRYGFKVQIT